MKKRKSSSFRYLRYRNLAQELAKFGYEYTPKKALANYGLIVLVAAIFGLLYKLDIPYILAIGIIGMGFLPMVILQTMKGRYHTTMFSMANNYMEQFLYSFKRNKTVLSALMETATLFDEGIFYELLEKAIEHIRFATDSEDPEREALDMVGEFFRCERVDAIHAFVIGAQRRGLGTHIRKTAKTLILCGIRNTKIKYELSPYTRYRLIGQDRRYFCVWIAVLRDNFRLRENHIYHLCA